MNIKTTLEKKLAMCASSQRSARVLVKATRLIRYTLFALLLITSAPSFAESPRFTGSGSDGSDGALNLTTAGTIEFDPKALGIDKDGDNVYHFTTINIAKDVIVHLSSTYIGGPVYWLASGDVTIDGTVDLSGEAGQAYGSVPRRYSIPGPGGYPGAPPAGSDGKGLPGLGPGGGQPGDSCNNYPGATGFAAIGWSNRTSISGAGGASYGNIFLVPLLGGSGGAGNASGGGAGGGALMIASNSTIKISGVINSNGGNGTFGNNCYPSMGGSGGSIHLLAPRIEGVGSINAAGGYVPNWGVPAASVGRIRIETYDYAFTGSIDPTPTRGTPYKIYTATNSPSPHLKVTTVDGVAVASNPLGSFKFPDVVISNGKTVTVQIEAHNVPVGTVAHLRVTSENSNDQNIDSTPLAGTLETSTATVQVTLPPGFSNGLVDAQWMPQ